MAYHLYKGVLGEVDIPTTFMPVISIDISRLGACKVAMVSKVFSWLSPLVLLLVAAIVAVDGLTPTATAAAAFNENYMVEWGADGYHLIDRGTEVNLAMDQSSGTCVHCMKDEANE